MHYGTLPSFIVVMLFKSSSKLHISLSEFSQRPSSIQEVPFLAQLQRSEPHHVLRPQRSSSNA